MSEARMDAMLEQAVRTRHEMRKGFMNGRRIDHVVVLMLENRGFDHFMGWLYERSDPRPVLFPGRPGEAGVPENQARLRDFEGLDGLPPDSLRCPFNFRDKSGVLHEGSFVPRKGARAPNIPRVNPHEDFIHIFEDMYRQPHAQMRTKAQRDALVKQNGAYKAAPMNGWCQNFADGIQHHTGEETFTDDQLSEILDMYVPEQLPVMSFLARHYSLSDLWFCSVPSQTNTNRAFWTAGTSSGLVTNNFYDAFKGSRDLRKIAFRSAAHGSHADRFPATPARADDVRLPGGEVFHDELPREVRTLFDVLDEHGVSWRYYWHAPWPPAAVGGKNYTRTMFPHFLEGRYDANFPKMEQFWSDVRAGRLAALTYIEPTWGGGPAWNKTRSVGNEFHPVQDVAVGEFYVKQVYEAIAESDAWERTLLVLTFDENGGTYDHFPPWPAVPSGRDRAPAAHDHPDHDKQTGTQFGFEFDVYGVRVPTLLISPWVPPRTVFRSPTEVPFDHTSIIATVLKWQAIDALTSGLGDRVAYAPTFDGVLRADAPRRKDDATVGIKPLGRPGPAGTALKYGDELVIRYAPRWMTERWRGPAYLGGPASWGGYWYPIMTDKAKALRFRLDGTQGSPALNGRRTQLVVAAGEARGYLLAVPDKAPRFVHSVFLEKDSDEGSRWRPWLANDRLEDKPLWFGDELMFLSEVYLAENINTGMTGFDPYQKLAPDWEETGKTVYAKYRPAEWDIWVVEAP